MVSAEAQKPLCPVCHQADKVKTLQAAYNEGLERFAPPPMPGKTVSMLRYMVVSMLIIGICIFFILEMRELFRDLLEAIENTSRLAERLTFSLENIGYEFPSFPVPHGHSMDSFLRTIVWFGAQQRYAAWDRAMQNWNRLRYCARDDVVFDPQTGKTVSQETLSSLLSTEVKEEEQIAQSSASAVHQ